MTNKEKTCHERVKCPFCAELIMPEALKCPFCRSDLVKSSLRQQNKPQPALLWVMFYNLLCPGMGAWKLGCKIRGALIFLAVMLCFLIWAYQMVPVMQQLGIDISKGRIHSLNSLTADIENNPWLDVSFYVYLFSFIDVFFLFSNRRKPSDTGSAQ